MTAQKEFVTSKLGTFQVPIYIDLVRITEIDTSKFSPKIQLSLLISDVVRIYTCIPNLSAFRAKEHWFHRSV
jgi:hypothetical protein